MLEMPVSSLKPQLSPNYLKQRLTNQQKSVLEKVFASNKNPNESELLILAHETGLTMFDIKVWFENSWAEWRQEQGFPASGRSVHEM